MVQPKVKNASKVQHSHLSGLQEGKSKLLLFSRVPRRDKITQTREDTTLCDTKKDSDSHHPLPICDEICTLVDVSPGMLSVAGDRKAFTRVMSPNEIATRENTILGPKTLTAIVAGSWKVTLDRVNTNIATLFCARKLASSNNINPVKETYISIPLAQAQILKEPRRNTSTRHDPRIDQIQ
jgi:hypothetical protein